MGQAQQENERIVRAGYDAFNRRDWDAAVRAVGEGFEMVSVPTAESFSGAEGLGRYLRGWAGAFPDLRVEVMSVCAEECRVAVEVMARGTHTGPLVSPGGEIAPTGRAVSLHVLDLWDLREGHTVRARTYYDSVCLLRQMGLEADPEAPAVPLVLDLTGVRIGGPEAAHRDVARRLFAALATGEAEVLDALYAPGFPAEPSGPAGVRALADGWREAFPDLAFHLDAVLADGDRVAVRWSAAGTHLGPLAGSAPTGRAARWAGASMWRMEDGRVAEDWVVFDAMGMLEPLGLAPVPEGAAG